MLQSYIDCLINGSVVDQDDFLEGMRLSLQRGEHISKTLPRIERGDSHCDIECRHHDTILRGQQVPVTTPAAGSPGTGALPPSLFEHDKSLPVFARITAPGHAVHGRRGGAGN